MLPVPDGWYELGSSDRLMAGDKCTYAPTEAANTWDIVGEHSVGERVSYWGGRYRFIRKGAAPRTEEKIWVDPWD